MRLGGGPPDRVVVVAITSRRPEADDGIYMPNLSDHPSTASGLSKPCWAMPQWILAVRKESLGELIGYLGGSKLQQVLTNVADFADSIRVVDP